MRAKSLVAIIGLWLPLLLVSVNLAAASVGKNIQESESSLTGAMNRVNQNIFAYRNLLVIRHSGIDLLEEGLGYLKKENHDPQKTQTVLSFAVNVARFHPLKDDQIQFIRKKYVSLSKSTMNNHVLEGLALFYDERTIQILEKVQKENPPYAQHITDLITAVRNREEKNKTSSWVPYFASSRPAPEIEIIFCALAGASTLEDGMRVRNHIIKHIGVEEVLAGIDFYRTSEDEVLKQAVKNVAINAAKWSPENKQLVALVDDFKNQVIRKRKINRLQKKVVSTEEVNVATNTHRDSGHTDNSSFKEPHIKWLVGASLLLVCCGAVTWIKLNARK